MRSLPRMPALRRTAADSHRISNCVIYVPPGPERVNAFVATKTSFDSKQSRRKARVRHGSEVLNPQVFRKSAWAGPQGMRHAHGAGPAPPGRVSRLGREGARSRPGRARWPGPGECAGPTRPSPEGVQARTEGRTGPEQPSLEGRAGPARKGVRASAGKVCGPGGWRNGEALYC